MGLADTVTKAYMKENTVFADAFNYLITVARQLLTLRCYRNWIPQK